MTKPIHIELPTTFAIGSANAYLFIEPEPTLVDCGLKSEASWQALQTILGEHSLLVSDLKQVIITHAHVDHMGLAGRIVAESQAQVWTSDLVYRWAVNLQIMLNERIEFLRIILDNIGLATEQKEATLNYMRRIPAMWDSVPAERVTTFPIDSSLEIGGMTWQSIYTPGHCNTQSCFYQPDTRQFLAADMLLPQTPAPVLEQPLDGSQERVPSLPQFIESMAMVEAMDIEWVYPGHGKPFVGHRELIQDQRQRIAKRKEECYKLIATGHRTVTALVDIMYSHMPAGARFSGLSMLIGYLDLLQLEGRITQQTIDGVWHYNA